MTEPRDDEQRPSTRRMEPIDPSAESTTSRHPRQEPVSYAESTPGAYSDPGYRDPDPYQGEPGASPRRLSSRTVLLALIAGLAVLVLALAAFLVFTGPEDDEADDRAAVPSRSTTTSETTTSSSTPPTSASITYQITGNGNLVGLRYRDETGEKVVAATAAPWSVRVTLKPSSSVQLTAIVVTGPVTCNILYDGEPLATATSNGGPLSCQAQIPG